jgi:enterochelin esterase-like enzyme
MVPSNRTHGHGERLTVLQHRWWARHGGALLGALVVLAAALGGAAAVGDRAGASGLALDLTAAGGGSGSATAPASGPARVEVRLLTSASLGRTLPYAVFLPPGYDTDRGARYPVLYLLHGLGGSYRQWGEYGLAGVAERLMRRGEIQPFIVVMPEGEAAYWLNHANNGARWADYVVRDLVGEIDATFRTRTDRAHRAIGGNSMGAHGAIQLAMNHPDRFGAVGMHSLALRRHKDAFPFFGDQAYFNAHDPVYLVQTRPAVARSFALWLDIGTEDTWREADRGFQRQLAGASAAHQWREHAGGHDAAYWTAHLAEYLGFYGAALSRPSTDTGAR